MGAGSESSERPEPLVPSVPEKTKPSSTSPSKTPPTAPPATPSPAKGVAAPPSASISKPPPAPRESSQKGAMVTAEQLTAAVTVAAAPASGSQAQSIVLHVGRAAVAAGEKVSAQLGRVVELNRGTANLGALQHLMDKWNLADITDATLGIGKDGKGVLDSRKQVFEELLWEHQSLSEAFAALQLSHSNCQAALPEGSVDDLTTQVTALKAAKEELAAQHQHELKVQREETAKLKDQLIQAGLEYAKALNEAISAGNAQVEEAKKQFTEAEAQLRRELEDEQKWQQEQKEQSEAVEAYLAGIEAMVKDTDEKALKLFPDSQMCAEAAVAKIQVEEVVDTNLPWTSKDRLVAVFSRILHMRVVDRTLAQLPEAAIAAFKSLWPGETVPDNTSLVAERL
nr:formin-like protein 16 [Lolium perenne]